MDWLRQAIGVSAPPPPPKRVNPTVERKLARAQQQPEESSEVQLQRRVRADEAKLKCMQDEITDLRKEAAGLVRASRDPKCPANLRVQHQQKAKELLAAALDKDHLAANKAKALHNLRGQLSVMQTANSNLDHALLVKQGADELESIVEATASLNVEDDVDRLRDAAATAHEHNALFAEDMGLSGNPMAGLAQEQMVDEELEALMRDQHDEDMDALLGEMHANPALLVPTQPPLATTTNGQPRPPNTPPQVIEQNE